MAAQSWNLPLDAALTRLQDAYHGWKIWYVPLALGGLTWCAKRHADGTLLHAAAPADLAEYLSDADAVLRGDPPSIPSHARQFHSDVPGRWTLRAEIQACQPAPFPRLPEDAS